MEKEFKNNNTISALKIIRKLISHLSVKRKKKLIIILFLSILSSFAESISITMLIPFISFLIDPESFPFEKIFNVFFNILNFTNNDQKLGFISFLFISIVLLSGYIKLKYMKMTNLITDQITSDFRIRLFNFLLIQDFSHFFKHGTNEILSNLSIKINTMSTMVFTSINILNSILISVAITLVLIINEPFYTPLIILGIGLFFVVIFKVKSKNVLKKGNKVNLNSNFIIDIFENTVGYLPEIIVYNLKNFFSLALSKASKENARSHAEIRTISMSPRIYLEVFVVVFVVVFMYFSGFADRSMEINISYLAILAFGAQKVLPLINNIYLSSINFKGSTPTVLSFLNLLGSGKNETIDQVECEKLNFNKLVKLEKISFRYDKNLPFVLKEIEMEINKGEKVFIKGETGSGKSTLINIISGLLDPLNGRILVDGVEINTKNKKSWQKNISIVPQTTFLNDASILENIAIGVDLGDVDIEKVKKCAKLAFINKFIEDLPEKYNQKVGQGGTRLSGGQKQRIGLARSLYRESSLIIMDEPTNALDFDTENNVVNSIVGLKDITVIMVSHSNNSLKYFDKIIDLNKQK
jgi:ABC-type multidrug transport system fused ATPase/permease subunit